MIDGWNFFDEPFKNNIRIMKIWEKFLLVKDMIIQLDVYLIIHISKKIIDLNKKQAMDVDPKTIQH